jgi:hypothetical protein
MSDEPSDDDEQVTARIRGLLERARRGNEAVLPQLREMLDTEPGLWRHFGDLAFHARRCWIDLIADADLALKESISRRVEELGRELSGVRPSAMEKLLVERILASWLQLEHAEIAAAQAKTPSVAVAGFVQKRLDRAHHRFLTSLGALATLRRLLPNTSEAGGSGDSRVPAIPAVPSSSTSDDRAERPRLRIACSVTSQP